MFIIDGKTKDELIEKDPKSAEIIKPILRGRDIKRYKAEFADKWLIFIPWHFPLHKDQNITGASIEAEKTFQKQYPVLYEHLLQYKDKLSKRNRAETGIRYEWYALQRCAATYYEEFEKEKIAFPVINRKWNFQYVPKGIIILAPMRFITSNNSLKYIKAVFGSTIIKYYWTMVGSMQDRTGFQMDNYVVEQIPIPKISKRDQKPFEKLVDTIIAKKEKGEDTKKEEQTIDIMVYKLYGLTYEEVKTIGPVFFLAEKEYEEYEFTL